MTLFVSTGESIKQFSIATDPRRENKEYILLMMRHKPLNLLVIGDIPRRFLEHQKVNIQTALVSRKAQIYSSRIFNLARTRPSSLLNT